MSDDVRDALERYLRAMVEARWEDVWSSLSTADREAKTLAAFIAMVGNVNDPVAPQVIDSVREDGITAEATVIALCSLPLDPVQELARLEATGRGDSEGAQQLRRILSRWDGRYERRPRTVKLVKELEGWRVVERFSQPRT